MFGNINAYTNNLSGFQWRTKINDGKDMSAIFGDSFLEQRNKNVGFKISKNTPYYTDWVNRTTVLSGWRFPLGSVFACV